MAPDRASNVAEFRRKLLITGPQPPNPKNIQAKQRMATPLDAQIGEVLAYMIAA